MASSKKRPKVQPRRLKRIITRFDVELLERIDLAAATMGLNRTAFIVNAVAERLMQLDRLAAA